MNMATTPARCYYWLGGKNLNIGLLKQIIKSSRYSATFATLYHDRRFETHADSGSCLSDLSSANKEKKNIANRKSRSLITTKDYLRIMAKQCSQPELQTEMVTDTPNPRRSETHCNKSTLLKTKHIVNTLSLHPKKVPSNFLPILENPRTQAQLRIYRAQQSAKENGIYHSCNSEAVFDVITSVQDCHKKGSSEVKKIERTAFHKKKSKLRKSRRSQMTPQQNFLLSPLAAYTVVKRNTMLRSSGDMALPSEEVKTNSLITIDPNEKCLPSKQVVPSSKAEILPTRPASLNCACDQETLKPPKEFTKEKVGKLASEKCNAQQKNLSPDDLDHGLLSGDKVVSDRRLLHKVNKVVSLSPDQKAMEMHNEQKALNENRLVRTVTTEPVGINTSSQNTVPAVEADKGSSKKSPIKKLKQTKTSSLVQKDPLETPHRVRADSSMKPINEHYLCEKEKVTPNLIDHNLRKNIPFSERNLNAVKKGCGHSVVETTDENKRNPCQERECYSKLQRKTSVEKQKGLTIKVEKGKAHKDENKIEKINIESVPCGVSTKNIIEERELKEVPIKEKKQKYKQKILERSWSEENMLKTKINAKEKMCTSVKTHGKVPFQGKTLLYKNNVFRTIVKKRTCLPEDGAGSKNVAEGQRPRDHPIFLRQKPPNPKQIIFNDHTRIGIPLREEMTPSKIMHTNKMQKHHSWHPFPFVTIKGKYFATTMSKDTDLRDYNVKDTGFLKGKMKSEKGLIGAAKNEIKSSVPAVKFNSIGEYFNYHKTVFGFQMTTANKLKKEKGNNDNVPVQIFNNYPDGNKEPQMIKIEKNKCLLTALSVTAKEKDINADINKYIQMKNHKTAKNLVDSPNNRLLSKHPVVMRAIPMKATPFIPNLIPIEEPNEFEENDKHPPTPAANGINFHRERFEALTPRSDFKEVLKERLSNDTAIGVLPEDKNIASVNNINFKANVIDNNRKVEPVRDSAIREEKPRKIDDVTESFPALYAKSLKEAVREYMPYIDTELMTQDQKSVLYILTRYLASIEADLLSEMEYEVTNA